jgi:hypothetical protein
VPSRAPPPTGPGISTGRTKSVAKRKKEKLAEPDDDLIERVPNYNVDTVHVGAWRRLREANPYRFEQPTYPRGDRFFWTITQQHLWDDYYNSPECMKNGLIVMPKAINTDVLMMHQADSGATRASERGGATEEQHEAMVRNPAATPTR